MWQGLGYYSRARNLHYAAKSIVKNGFGVFPNSFEEIKKLKGVGDYTAAAIASFAFHLPYPVVDGNVKRVVTRYFGIKEDISKAATTKEINRHIQNIFNPKECDSFNQAIMEFGALQCVPKNPICEKCVFNKKCCAYLNNEVNQIPINKKKITRKHRYFHYFVLKCNNTTVLNKRVENDIWKNMYDFPSIEKISKIEIPNISELLSDSDTYQVNSIADSPWHRQLLTHQVIHAKFWEIEVANHFELLNKNSVVVKEDDFSNYPMPKLIEQYLNAT